MSREDSDEQYCKRDLKIPGESDQLLQFIPWKEALANPDPRRFNFAIICCHCRNYQNTLRGMRMQLAQCPCRCTPKLLCDHCKMILNKCNLLVDHLNVKGRQGEPPCKPQYKMEPLGESIFPPMPTTLHPHTLQKLAKGTKTQMNKEQPQRKYNSWATFDPDSCRLYETKLLN